MGFAKRVLMLPETSAVRKQAEELLSGKKKPTKKKKVAEITYEQFLLNKAKLKK